MDVRRPNPEDIDGLLAFFARIPAAERTFFKEEVLEREDVEAWGTGPGRRALACDGGDVVGYVAVVPLGGWSDHVGEIRLVVAPSHRGSGLGRELARRALTEAVGAGLTKLVVEVVAEQGAALALFTALGFTGEALLTDHIRDRTGHLRDLMVLAHHVDRTWSGMDTVGVADELSST